MTAATGLPAETAWRIWSDPGAYAMTISEKRAASWWEGMLHSRHDLIRGSLKAGRFTLLTGPAHAPQLITLARADRRRIPPEGAFSPVALATRQWAIPTGNPVSRETLKNGTSA